MNEFLERESEDLSVHVENCQRRFEALNTRLSRLEVVAWSILTAVLVGGGITIRELLPIARAFAGVP